MERKYSRCVNALVQATPISTLILIVNNDEKNMCVNALVQATPISTLNI